MVENTSPIYDDDEERVEIELIKTFCDTSRQSGCQTPRVSFWSDHYWWLWPRVLILVRDPLLMKKKGRDWTFCDTSRPWPRVVILVRYPFPRCSHRSDSLRQKRQVRGQVLTISILEVASSKLHCQSTEIYITANWMPDRSPDMTSFPVWLLCKAVWFEKRWRGAFVNICAFENGIVLECRLKLT